MALVGRACFDESGTGADAADLCLGGYIFREPEAFAFDAAWRDMLATYRLPYFHMKECVHNVGVFGHLSAHDCDLAARRAISLIQAHADQGVAISVDKSVAPGLMERSPWGNVYALATGQTMFAVQSWAFRVGAEGSVAYFFEAGATGWFQAQEAATKFMGIDSPEARALRIASFAQLRKADSPHIQAADMLAWHILKFRRRQRDGIKEKRKDFRELLKVFTDYHHYDRAALEFLQHLRAGQA